MKSSAQSIAALPRHAGATPWIVMLLIAAVMTSAIAVIYSSHRCRQLYGQLQEMQAGRWHMEEEWGRLLLQESTLASPYLVAQSATEELEMYVPDAAELRLVAP